MSRALVLALALALTAWRTQGKPTLVDECGDHPADLVFILDVSSSIWPKHFREHVLTFVKEVVSSLHIGPGPEHTRVGAVTYSDRPQLEFYLNQYVDKAALLHRVSQIKPRGGNTNTHEALAFVDRNLFSPERGARSNVSRIVIVITDGASRMVQATLEAARALRNHGATVFAIGVGSEVRVEELRGMASEPSEHFVFEVTNFQALANIKSELVIKTCKVEVTTQPPTTSTTTSTPEPSTTTEATTPEPTTTTEVASTTTESPTTTTTTTTEMTTSTTEPATTMTEGTTITATGEIDLLQGDMATVACINHPAEVYFVLDSSSSIWKVHFQRDVLDFVRDMIDVLDIGSDLTRVGVITYSDAPTTVFGLASYVHKDELMKAINKDNIRYNPGLTYTAEALQTARTNLISEGRPGVQQIIILLTDGQSRDPAATQQVAQAARRDGVTLFAVGVGDGVDLQELHAVASQPSEDFVLTVDDFAGLAASRKLLAAKTCAAIGHASASGSGNGSGPGSPGKKEEPLPHRDQAAVQTCGLQRADVLVAYDWNTLGSIAATQLTSALYHLSTTLQLRTADVTVGTLAPSSCLTPVSTALSGTVAFEKHAKSVLRMQQSSMAAVLKTARLSGFTAKNGHRAAAKKVLVVVLDAAATSHLGQVAAESARLRSDDVEIFVVTSGLQGSRLVEEAASEPKFQHVIRLPGLDFSNHAYVSTLLAKALCGDLLLRM